VKWAEAWRRAEPTLDGVVHGRVPASEPGVELATLDWGGDGELVVIHHANGFCAATYALIAVELRDRYRVVSFDARGHGDSTPVAAAGNSAAYDWARMAADYAVALSHLVEALGRDSIRFAIGHSFGGMLTLGAAAQRPGLVAETLLLDPVVIPPSKGGEKPPNRGPDLASMARRRRAVFSTREEAYDHFAGRGLFEAFRPEALALYVAKGMTETRSGEMRLKCDPSVEAAVFENGGTLDVFALAAKIETRTRFLHAARGNFSLDVYDELAGRMPDARVDSLDVGHLFAMENPEVVVDYIAGVVGGVIDRVEG
jgi:pimeloyl-ACP methyl ester carboxylesterase